MSNRPPSRRLFLQLPCLLAAASAACASTRQGTSDVAGRVVSVQQWGGKASPLPATAQSITHLTIHHQGELWNPDADVPAYLRRLQGWSRMTKGWADIPYHWIVAPDGTVYAARPWQLAGDTNTEYDPRGHLLVMLLGNFEVQHPTPAQWDAAVALVAGLQRDFGLGADRIATHKDHSAQTVCPGAHLYARLAEFKAAVQAYGR
jgi:N-acetylmuramoyl-L-alanine amidase